MMMMTMMILTLMMLMLMTVFLGGDDDDDDECPSRRLINNLADISDKAIPVKRRDRKNGHHSNTWNMDQSVLINNKKREETSKVILQSSVLSAHDSDGPQTTND